MKSNYKLFKTLQKEDFNELKFKVERSYSYKIDNDIKELKEQEFQNTNNKKIFQLVDEEYEWNPKQQSAYISLHISMKNMKSLFLNNKFCYSDAVLALGLIWKPQKSRIRQCKKLFEFDITKDEIDVYCDNIELTNISSNVDFSIIMYICRPGNKNNSLYIGNETGLILYEEYMWSIIIDGNGSIFPIYEEENEGGPLWSYYCDCSDIEDDFFDNEHIKIVLNKSHPGYDMIHHESKNYNPILINEILSAAMALIILDIRDKYTGNKYFDLHAEVENGSILQAIIYFHDKLGFKVNDSYSDLLNSIKTYFDKEV